MKRIMERIRKQNELRVKDGPFLNECCVCGGDAYLEHQGGHTGYWVISCTNCDNGLFGDDDNELTQEWNNEGEI